MATLNELVFFRVKVWRLFRRGSTHFNVHAKLTALASDANDWTILKCSNKFKCFMASLYWYTKIRFDLSPLFVSSILAMVIDDNKSKSVKKRCKLLRKVPRIILKVFQWSTVVPKWESTKPRWGSKFPLFKTSWWMVRVLPQLSPLESSLPYLRAFQWDTVRHYTLRGIKNTTCQIWKV